MNKKLIALSMATVMLSTTMASELQPNDNTIEVNAADIFSKKKPCAYLKIDWGQDKNDDKTLTLSKLELNDDNDPDSITDLRLIIPGMIEEKQVHIEPAAFSDLQSNTLRLHLKFQEVNGKKAQMPDNSESMFSGSNALTSIDFSGASTEKVTNMAGMFACCDSLTQLDLKNVNTQNVENMEYMFESCSNLTQLDLSTFNTRNVQNMAGMFCGCSSLTQLDLKNFNTQNVKNMEGMFENCSNLTQLDLSSFDTQNVKNMEGMFYNCGSLTKVDVSKLDIRKITGDIEMFGDCNEHAINQIQSAFVRGNLHDFRSELNQIYWRACCSEREFLIKNDKSDKKYDWILEEQYEDSRSKVIGEAIGDCVAGKNEFANKKPEDIITFEGTSPENYEQKHWNAVILYNYVHEMINSISRDTKKYSSNMLDVIFVLIGKMETIYEYYHKEYYIDHADELRQSLERALAVIHGYVGALSLDEILRWVGQYKWMYDSEHDPLNLAPAMGASYTDEVLEYTTSFKQPTDSNKGFSYRPTFRYYDYGLYISDLSVSQYYWDEKAKNGKGAWNMDDSADTCGTYDELKDRSKWLLQQLGGLVKLPSQELWNLWNKKLSRCQIF